MRIDEISISDIAAGRNWKISASWDPHEDPGYPPLSPAESFSDDDYVVYSAVFVTDAGKVTPMLLIKRVGDLDYGGEYLELKDGSWRRLGEEPDPHAPHGVDFIATPLQCDPSFDAGDQDHRLYHRDNFRQWAPALRS